jgi:gamma-butyrobetaine dioxygenase
VQVIADLFASESAQECRSEPVTQSSHMLQAAALARASGAPAPLVAAALLHDVGHFTPPVSGHDLVRGTGSRHSDTGANWLARWFGAEVTEPVRLHVAAKRYLCAVEPGYLAALSPASLSALGVQGGPMGTAERARFEAHPQACDALRLRRWDDAAKDPAAAPPAFGYYRSLLRRLLRPRPASVP